MTKLLQEAFEQAAKLPEEAQDQLAGQLLQELADEARWDEAFATSPDTLERLAADALAEFRAGRAQEAGFDEL